MDELGITWKNFESTQNILDFWGCKKFFGMILQNWLKKQKCFLVSLEKQRWVSNKFCHVLAGKDSGGTEPKRISSVRLGDM